MPNFTNTQLLCLQRVLINDIEISSIDEQDFTDVAEMEYLAERARCLMISLCCLLVLIRKVLSLGLKSHQSH